MNDKERNINFVQNINDKTRFILDVQSEIKRRAYAELETMKREVASSFINPKDK